jgi:hypothetical protein
MSQVVFLQYLIIVPSAILMWFLIYNLYLLSKVLKVYIAKNSNK